MSGPGPTPRRKRGNQAEITVAEVLFTPEEPQLTPAAARALLELLLHAAEQAE
ncbi:hypothetical protein Caci_4095 [Catenulispora acidiphila DSM 44928]|uniref:Uncharacterized protein n=1 Tax=Catenulispora acidiphila (strain DSM 44928 / JCM 14897 / NBRC 102108 / NRRL B-24433 / ID139908) TaxID=479433 RepID=C7QGB4_CATAD|nr:hypothetical protein [Catenulispora acidiphila]ACU72959.1 hypothetical protein Caci_4095 [Catenulispora acidiphila DSM 44928]